jgi:hypothetical protein
MNTIARVIFVAMLAFGSGCAKPDWIQQTLVKVDVTGFAFLLSVSPADIGWCGWRPR